MNIPERDGLDLAQNNEQFHGYTVFTLSFNGVPIKFVTLKDAEHTLTSRDTYWKEQLQKAREEERERIEAIFKEHVPPHAMDLEDSVWLKRLLNKAFGHD